MAQSNLLSIEPLNPTIGAVLRGVDLRELSDAAVEDIRGALLKHQVVFFEGQDLTPAQQRDAAARFGELHVHPLYPTDGAVPEIMVLDNKPENPTDNDHWHTDVTFLETPALGAFLYALQVPPSGGDTLWSSMTAAYKALSKPMRDFLDGLSAVHDFSHAFTANGLAGSAAGRAQYDKAVADHPPVIHPVVRTHPETGRKALYVNAAFTVEIVGMEKARSDALLKHLYAQAAIPEYQCRFRWTPGAIAFWDNRASQHYAASDYWPAVRRVERVTVIGDKPF